MSLVYIVHKTKTKKSSRILNKKFRWFSKFNANRILLEANFPALGTSEAVLSFIGYKQTETQSIWIYALNAINTLFSSTVPNCYNTNFKKCALKNNFLDLLNIAYRTPSFLISSHLKLKLLFKNIMRTCFRPSCPNNERPQRRCTDGSRKMKKNLCADRKAPTKR